MILRVLKLDKKLPISIAQAVSVVKINYSIATVVISWRVKVSKVLCSTFYQNRYILVILIVFDSIYAVIYQ